MAKKDKKAKAPKTVGEVKVPKAWRKSAKAALELAQNPLAREVLSAALVAGAAALAKRKTEKGASSPAKASVKSTELGNLIAQGVTALVAGLASPPLKKSADEGSAPHTQTPAGKPQSAHEPKRPH